jgi:hypothetical protein
MRSKQAHGYKQLDQNSRAKAYPQLTLDPQDNRTGGKQFTKFTANGARLKHGVVETHHPPPQLPTYANKRRGQRGTLLKGNESTAVTDLPARSRARTARRRRSAGEGRRLVPISTVVKVDDRDAETLACSRPPTAEMKRTAWASPC